MNDYLIKIILILLAAAIGFCFLWQRGIMILSAKRAVGFIGHRRRNSWGASVVACTGYTKRSLRLSAGKTYRFTFEQTLTDGEIKVILSQGKQPLLAFDTVSTTHTITADSGLYTVTTAFESASGDYRLLWEEI